MAEDDSGDVGTDVHPPPPTEAWPAVVGVARVGKRTKDLAKRILPGEIAVIDHEDLDTVATESLIAAGVVAVVNASSCISGRYPNAGPLLLSAAGVAVLDGVGSGVMEAVADGTPIAIDGDRVVAFAEEVVDGTEVARGHRQDIGTFGVVLEKARTTMGAELQRFAENTLTYIQREGHLLVDDPDIPEIDVDFRGRQVLVVVRGVDYKKDLELLRRSGYLKEQKPLLVGVDGGADAFLEMGMTPDVIIGDMDSVSERALRSGAALVVHGYADGRAPGSEYLDELGLDHAVFASVGTSEDIAMLMAYERGAELIVAVGTHSHMVDFLDKGRPGMASTFLVRLKVGPILVDAKGVNRLYTTHVGTRDLLPLVLAAIITMIIIGVVSEPIRTVVRGLVLPLR
ncbi:hypothetical protein HC251_10580 [Iamia sp. SCSIO 61187]|uniref:putative cytokinetic ring protein SteA n=1 Tax=Iamia sp. SCSIO 61187 TaxID=2722752 RepID=UPI001C628B3A|nr:putative cytokinetic ring protein SteA [Iamia sp. SCSIO 61187]QYG92831.1 hypothetical protein HC251_10580 [Iamia sp. SCSIO 61187]